MDLVAYHHDLETTRVIYIDIFLLCLLLSICIRTCCNNHNKEKEKQPSEQFIVCPKPIVNHTIDYYDRYKEKLKAMSSMDWIPNKKVWEKEYQDVLKNDIDELKLQYLHEMKELTLINLSLSEKLNNQTLTLKDGRETESDEESDSEYEDDDDDEDNNNANQPSLEEKMAIHKIRVRSKINDNERLISGLQTKLNSRMFLKRVAMEKRMAFTIHEKLVSLKNHFVIDNTPSGNVIMTYDKDKAFKYYCDKTVQRKILLVVCRKFVCTFHCVPLYQDDPPLRFIYEGKTNRFNFLKNSFT